MRGSSLFRRPEMLGIEGERAASGSFGEAESDPSMGGFTERVNDSETRDNETEWMRSRQGAELTRCVSDAGCHPE